LRVFGDAALDVRVGRNTLRQSLLVRLG